MSPKKFANQIEGILHGVSILLPMVFSIILLSLDMFNFAGGLRCGVAANPLGCDMFEQLECVRGENARQFQLYFGTVPTYICILLFYLSSLSVYCKIRQTIQRTRRRSMTSASADMERQAGIQCILYGLFFANTFVWSAILGALVAAGKFLVLDKMFAVLLLANIFYPLQGVFNFMVYLRPRYVEVRKANPLQTRVWALCEIFRGNEGASTSEMSTPRTRGSDELSRTKSQQDVSVGLKSATADLPTGTGESSESSLFLIIH
jgi:hypothetical protein